MISRKVEKSIKVAEHLTKNQLMEQFFCVPGSVIKILIYIKEFFQLYSNTDLSTEPWPPKLFETRLARVYKPYKSATEHFMHMHMLH